MVEEKREKPRVSGVIPVKIKDRDKISATETIDISPSGAYCRTLHPLPLLSEVAITLVVPKSTKGRKKNKSIECRGTVVRMHSVIVEGKTIGYDVAIFFNELEGKNRALLNEYIDQTLNKETEK